MPSDSFDPIAQSSSGGTERVGPGEVAAIVPAGGSGRRFGAAENKLFADLRGMPLWARSVQSLAACPQIGRIVMPVAAKDRPLFESRFGELLDRYHVELVLGGSQRNESVRQGLRAIQDSAAASSYRWVAVHDAARPLVTTEDIDAVIQAAGRSGAAILVAPVTGTLKFGSAASTPHDANPNTCDSGDASGSVVTPTRTVDRRQMWTALTPQVFELELLIAAHDRHRGRPATDDAELVERMGVNVALVPGRTDNLKVTHPDDLTVAAAILAARASR